MNTMRAGFGSRMSAWVRTWLRLQGHALFSSLGRLWRTPWMTLVTVLVIAVTLVLPLAFYLVLKNLHALSERIENHWQVSLFLEPEVDRKAADELLRKLESDRAVAEARLIDKETGLARFRRYSGFGDVLQALADNPLPIVIEVLPGREWENPEKLASLVERWQRWKGVDFVQWDMRWLQRLKAWLDLAERGAILAGVILGSAALLVVGNTVRLEIEDRRQEIEVMLLLGATNRFVRRPFLYLGFWYGCIGGGLAWILVFGLYLGLRPQVDRLAGLYGGLYHLRFAGPGEIAVFWGWAVLLGMAAAWLVVSRYLWSLRNPPA